MTTSVLTRPASTTVVHTVKYTDVPWTRSAYGPVWTGSSAYDSAAAFQLIAVKEGRPTNIIRRTVSESGVTEEVVG